MAIQAQLYPENLGFSLGGPQDLMESAYGFNEFCLNSQALQQKQQQDHQYLQYQQLLQQQRNQTSSLNAVNLFSREGTSNCHPSMASPQSLAAQIEKQRLDIDRFIGLQNERLKLVLQEQRKQLVTMLLSRYESRTQTLLKQKDEEITRAAKRTMELEEYVKRMEIENQTWQRAAKENEAMVISLNNTLEQLRESACLSSNGAEDAESCCDIAVVGNRGGDASRSSSNSRIANDEENRENRRQMMCKSCNCRSSCMIFLPCRHLSSCKACEASSECCPVCRTVKKASIEALLS